VVPTAQIKAGHRCGTVAMTPECAVVPIARIKAGHPCGTVATAPGAPWCQLPGARPNDIKYIYIYKSTNTNIYLSMTYGYWRTQRNDAIAARCVVGTPARVIHHRSSRIPRPDAYNRQAWGHIQDTPKSAFKQEYTCTCAYLLHSL
jgi:hypothetical protein